MRNIENILVAIDGSEHANKAIEFAASLAMHYNAAIHLLHVCKATDIPEDLREFIKSEEIKKPAYDVYLNQIGNRILNAAEIEAKKKGAMHVETSVAEGDPSEEIINYARRHDFDLIVIGSRGLGSIKGLLLGSVSTKICHATDRTCVVVR